VKLKRDFAFLLYVDQPPDLIIVRPEAGATNNVAATLYKPIQCALLMS
jgi:hypothetical protein